MYEYKDGGAVQCMYEEVQSDTCTVWPPQQLTAGCRDQHGNILLDDIISR